MRAPAHRAGLCRLAACEMAVLVAWPVVLGLGPAADRARAGFPGRNGLIAFASNKTGRWEIFTVRADGSHRQQLTHSSQSTNDWAPAFSPTGTKLAFYRYKANRDGSAVQGQIFTIDADGSHLRQLTRKSTSIVDGDPAYSADGKQVIFERYHVDSD